MTMPHIQTYYSSQTETLVESLLFQLENDASSPVNTPFGRGQILVPNSGMQRYLELKIAERFGICAHVDIHYVGQLLSATYKNLLDDNAPAHLDPRLLTFALLRLWGKRIMPMDSRFDKLHQQHPQGRQRYVWAQKIAQLLRQYLNERPEMIDRWQAGKLSSQHPHEAWQRDICQQLFASLGQTLTPRTQWQARLNAALQQATPDCLPQRIHLFGFHAIPSVQLCELFLLAQVSHLTFYTFNPSIAYWQDIVPEKVKNRLTMTQADEAALLSVGHPLLAAWGQSGKFYIEQLNEFTCHHLDDIVPPPAPNSVLTWLQSTIRQLSDAPADSLANSLAESPSNDSVDVSKLFERERQRHGDSNDISAYSISLNACANPRREVEVLYDNLCQRFAQQDLNPADVLVIIPQLNDYAPHIQAIFARDSDAIGIPYSLANQSTAEADADVQAFLSLLDVLDSDFQAPLLFEALSEARIQEALNLSQSHLDSLRYWFTESRFSLHFYDDSAGENSSLEKLLDSLLLAAVGGESATLGTRRASPLYYGGQQEALTQLCELWQRFVPFTSLKNKRLSLSAWRDQWRQLCATFLPFRHAMDDWLNDWYETLSALDGDGENSADSGATATYDFATVCADLSALLQNDTLHGPFLSGGVSFCAVVPMRSIPAKMIAVLGLNSDFPAIAAKNPLDVRLAKPLWSDRNPHKEQQYFFLETLMAARESLYLSHVGIDEKTGEAIPPSALVRELFGYIARYLPDFAVAVTRRYPLQGFVSQSSYQKLYTTPDVPRETSRATDALLPRETSPETAIALPRALTANALADILLEPLAAFWRYHLGAAPLDSLPEPLAEHEFIATENPLDKWRYRQTVLQTALADDVDAVRALQQENRYAPPVISQALLASADAYTRPLLTAIHALNLESNPAEINQQYRYAYSAEQTLYLRLYVQRYRQHGLLSYSVGKFSAKRRLRQWIAHVFYHSLPADASPCQSLALSLEQNRNSKKNYVESHRLQAFADRASAVAVLEKLLSLAQSLLQRPYAVTLQQSNKRDETLMHYAPAEAALHAHLIPAATTEVETLQAQWADIDASFRELQ